MRSVVEMFYVAHTSHLIPDKMFAGRLCELQAISVLLFSTVAYPLQLTLRKFGLKRTEPASTQAGTIPAKLLKVGGRGRSRFSVRRV